MIPGTVEFISHTPGDPEDWRCVCGNYPSGDGFYPCDTEGNEVEPTAMDWTSGLYACNGCRRIIDPDTMEVAGYSRPLQNETFSEKESDDYREEGTHRT
jgi:hypothetical protein